MGDLNKIHSLEYFSILLNELDLNPRHKFDEITNLNSLSESSYKITRKSEVTMGDLNKTNLLYIVFFHDVQGPRTLNKSHNFDEITDLNHLHASRDK